MYVGLRLMIEGIARTRVFRPELIVDSGMFSIVTIPVCARNQFCWICFLTVVASIDWIESRGIRCVLESDGGVGFKTDGLIIRNFNRV